ncbi:sensor histidine kinase [Pseudonocardia kunmingensis]|uniref:Anti-sigma regulatory factor (Ser/Thr protein kinase) n=1 Tax=Pseudonocardia kunmingensis TaxID=630975 RepID=A0A543D0Z7_9PSEU|nr:sensor histidine kinase [Pseudonocardia kunmingensis]TQM02868.1 anti-sigma regulatory factor (Ser/Thr protein kinase) [Pseudonocardia kunmingensis]
MTGDDASGSRPPHAATVYGSAEDLRRRVLPFLRNGLAAGDDTVAIVSPEAAEHLGTALGADRDGVRWQLPDLSYRSLGPMFSGLRAYLADQSGSGNRVRLLAENTTDTDDARTAAYLRFEAASNDVLGAFGYPWVCLYDRRRYPAHVLDHVSEVHPYLLDLDGRTTRSEAFLRPGSYLGAHPGPLSAVPRQVGFDVRLAAPGQLAEVRHAAVEAALALGLATDDDYDFELAATEAMTNAVSHGERPCRVRLWTTPDRIVLRVDDHGPGDDIAIKGFHPPDPTCGHLGGMGMWMIRQLADAVHVDTGPAGTTVEIQFPLPHIRPAIGSEHAAGHQGV